MIYFLGLLLLTTSIINATMVLHNSIVHVTISQFIVYFVKFQKLGLKKKKSPVEIIVGGYLKRKKKPPLTQRTILDAQYINCKHIIQN